MFSEEEGAEEDAVRPMSRKLFYSQSSAGCKYTQNVFIGARDCIRKMDNSRGLLK